MVDSQTLAQAFIFFIALFGALMLPLLILYLDVSGWLDEEPVEWTIVSKEPKDADDY